MTRAPRHAVSAVSFEDTQALARQVAALSAEESWDEADPAQEASIVAWADRTALRRGSRRSSSGGRRRPNPSSTNVHEPSDYWTEFAERLEALGIEAKLIGALAAMQYRAQPRRDHRRGLPGPVTRRLGRCDACGRL